MFKVCIYACPSLEGGPATSAELAGILRTDVGMQCSTAAAVTATEQEVGSQMQWQGWSSDTNKNPFNLSWRQPSQHTQQLSSASSTNITWRVMFLKPYCLWMCQRLTLWRYRQFPELTVSMMKLCKWLNNSLMTFFLQIR